MTAELIEFYAKDGVALNGYIIKNKKKTKKLLIEIHGMTSNCFKKRERVIAETAVKMANVDTICINTRGSEITKYIKNTQGEKKLAGTAYEDIEESYYDILGIVEYALNLGYTSIYLQGHSLGATKVVFSYMKMIEENVKKVNNIKGIILLSLVDIPELFRILSCEKFLPLAEKMEKDGKTLTLMPEEAFIHPISVKTYLKYTKYNNDIDFAQYNKKDYKFEVINKIKIPIFMRWGNNKELVNMKTETLVELMNNVIKNKNKDISYIDGADHTYSDKEYSLAQEIVNFIKKMEG